MRGQGPTPEFRALLDAAPDAMLIVDGKGRIVQANAQSERLFGFSRSEMIGQPVETLIPERFQAAHPGYRRDYFAEPRARPMGHLGRELFARRRDGSEFPAEVSLSPLTVAGETFAIAAIRDGTVRRVAEEHFRKLLDAAPDAMVTVGVDGRIAHVNAQAAVLFGYPRHEMIDQPVEILIPTRFRAAHPAHRRNYFAEPRTRPMGGGGLQLFGLRKDGTEFPAEISLSPLVTEDGTLAITAIRDITDRRRVEEEHLRLLQAEEAVRMRDEFISIASHELKTPLTAIQMQLDAITRALERQSAEAFQAIAAEKLRRVRRSTKRLSGLTDQLLDISRITGGRVALEYQLVDLAEVVRATVAQFDDELVRAGCALTADLPEEGLIAPVDSLRIEQVVTNLLANAVKYGRGKPIEIRLRAQSGHAILTVRDHGIGIAAEHMNRVFDKFERAVSHRQYGGFGLGLWISRQLIEAHHGRISVESQPGAGSTFTVTVPLSLARSERPRPGPATKGRLVLVVDDDAEIREALVDALAGEGIDVLTADDGQHALDILRRGCLPDVVLLDLMMPRMDGYVFRAEQQRDPALAQIPVVVMSAASDAEQQARRMACGFLRKPATLEALVAVIEHHAGGVAPES